MNKITPKRIVFVANTSWSIFNFRLGLLLRLKELGFEIIVIAPRDAYSSRLIAHGFQFYHFPFNSYSKNPFSELLGILKLIRMYRSIAPDLSFHYTAKPNIYGSIAAWICRQQSIAITTGLGIFREDKSKWTKWVLRWFYRVTGLISKEVWFLNEDDLNYFLDRKLVKENKTRLLPSEGVNISWFAPNYDSLNLSQKKKIRFLFAGRIVWSKGVREFCEAASIIKATYKNVIFDMIGFIVPEHPDGVSFNLVQDWHKSKLINYLGQTDDIRPFIEEADCIILPSYHEGVSRLLLEAASMAKPIIATNVVGCKEVVDHGVNGFLCKTKNTKDLVNKIELFLDLPKVERFRMGLAGRKKVIQEFDEEIIINHYIQSIKRFLDYAAPSVEKKVLVH